MVDKKELFKYSRRRSDIFHLMCISHNFHDYKPLSKPDHYYPLRDNLPIEIPFDPEYAEKVIEEFIKTYVEVSGARGVVIGLSGGIDSAVVSVLCRKILGKRKVKCLFLPEKATPKNDIKHKEILVEMFDLNCKDIDISRIVENISEISPIKPDKISLANIKARTRMIFLYEYANSTKSIVCGTSNKSELLIGYFTKYGDGGADIMPIGDLYKTQVFQLARHLGIPEEIIKKPPSAGLWRGQTDEKEIGISYNILDQILYGLELKMSPHEIAEKIPVSIDVVKKVREMRAKSQHKRRTPLIPKIGIRTIGLDWRSPVVEG